MGSPEAEDEKGQHFLPKSPTASVSSLDLLAWVAMWEWPALGLASLFHQHLCLKWGLWSVHLLSELGPTKLDSVSWTLTEHLGGGEGTRLSLHIYLIGSDVCHRLQGLPVERAAEGSSHGADRWGQTVSLPGLLAVGPQARCSGISKSWLPHL